MTAAWHEGYSAIPSARALIVELEPESSCDQRETNPQRVSARRWPAGNSEFRL